MTNNISRSLPPVVLSLSPSRLLIPSRPWYVYVSFFYYHFFYTNDFKLEDNLCLRMGMRAGRSSNHQRADCCCDRLWSWQPNHLSTGYRTSRYVFPLFEDVVLIFFLFSLQLNVQSFPMNHVGYISRLFLYHGKSKPQHPWPVIFLLDNGFLI